MSEYVPFTMVTAPKRGGASNASKNRITILLQQQMNGTPKRNKPSRNHPYRPPGGKLWDYTCFRSVLSNFTVNLAGLFSESRKTI